MRHPSQQERRSAKQPLFVLTTFILILLGACSPEKRNVSLLYDVDSLIQTQIDYLSTYKTSVEKQAVLDGVRKTTIITPKDSAAWDEELGIFVELNVINKPSNKELYKVEHKRDSKSNLNVKSFVSTEELPVAFLKIYYDRSLDQVRKIEAQYNESNALYKSTRYLTLEFEQIFNKTLLTAYAVSGGQKMFLDDSVQYSIQANIAVKRK